jgi:hypothetical protein
MGERDRCARGLGVSFLLSFRPRPADLGEASPEEELGNDIVQLTAVDADWYNLFLQGIQYSGSG